MTKLSLVYVVVLLALLQYTFFTFMVGRARGRYGISAPSITGHEEFERYYRVQMNTVELLVAFLPAMFIGAATVAAWFSASLGIVYLIGRQMYFSAYIRDPKSRSLGFVLSLLPIIILLVTSLVSSVMTMISGV